MWYSENCFEAWSAHLLPQTGRDLGMRSCMIGMHGLHNLFNNIRWNVGPCVVWKCIGTWRNMLPTYLRTVGCPVFWCGRAGDITLLVVLETLGTLRYRTFAGINNWTTGGPWQGMRTGGQIWCHSSYPFEDHLKGINVYIALLFSPVPFTGCLRAYRFHFTSLRQCHPVFAPAAQCKGSALSTPDGQRRHVPVMQPTVYPSSLGQMLWINPSLLSK